MLSAKDKTDTSSKHPLTAYNVFMLLPKAGHFVIYYTSMLNCDS